MQANYLLTFSFNSLRTEVDLLVKPAPSVRARCSTDDTKLQLLCGLIAVLLLIFQQTIHYVTSPVETISKFSIVENVSSIYIINIYFLLKIWIHDITKLNFFKSSASVNLFAQTRSNFSIIFSSACTCSH